MWTLRMVKGSASQPILYVNMAMNRRGIDTIVDKGVITNFISNAIVSQLGLKVSAYSNQVKAINSKAQAIVGKV